MGLSSSEAKELAQLEKEFGSLSTVPRGLSKKESQELADLEKEFGPKPEPESLGRRLVRSTINTALPAAGTIGGGLLASPGGPLAQIPAGAAGYAGGKHAARLLNHYLLGDPLEAKGLIGAGIQTGKDLKEGVEFELLGQSAAAVPGVIASMGKGTKKFAEKAAVNSTGATGKQASEFSDDAGRQLLDRKIVRFGDSQEKIAKRAADAVKEAENQISRALTSLDESGVTVDDNAILNVLRSKIKELTKDPSKADVVRLLENEAENVAAAAKARGNSVMPVSEGEMIKRGYNRKAGNWMDPEKGMAGKEMYQTYRDAVEAAAQSEAPATGKLFKDAKESYGLLRPIEEAAGRRAATTQQHPVGGFLDMISAAGGALVGGGPGAILAPIFRRYIAPRVSSSTAVVADKVGNMLLKSQYFQKMATENPEAFSAMVISIANKKGEAGLIPKAAAQE